MGFKIKIFLPVLFIFGVFGLANASHAGTINAASCSLTDISSAISSAFPGDTVQVPAGTGSCVWNGTLTVTKGVKLIGPGANNLTITNAYDCTGSEKMITYTPDNPAANNPFRISGFTFDGGGKCPILLLDVSNSNDPQINIRIDHNVFQNTKPNDTTLGVSITNGGAWGVIDNNTLSGYIPVRNDNGGGKAWWDNWNGINYGSSENLYFEDSIINITGIVTDCQESERYAFRYNTISMTDSAYPMFDLHGNSTWAYSCFGGEIYGNNVVSTVYQKLNQQRGGKMIVFDNNCTDCNGAFYAQVRTEQYGVQVTANPCPDGSGNYCAKDGAYEQVSDSYYWNNLMAYTVAYHQGTTDVQNTYGGSGGTVPPPALDTPLGGRDFFDTTTSPGITCGSPGNRPATCSTGQGFWATNQSPSDLHGLVGKSPLTPISGTLYKCTTPNVWTAYFTPYTYPHPLRTSGDLADGDTVAPAPPSGLVVQ